VIEVGRFWGERGGGGGSERERRDGFSGDEAMDEAFVDADELEENDMVELLEADLEEPPEEEDEMEDMEEAKLADAGLRGTAVKRGFEDGIRTGVEGLVGT
jgi:hypothetical protein